MIAIPKPLLVLIAFLLNTYTNAQSWKWGRGHEEIGAGQSMATGTATDRINGVYTVGWYHGTIIFGQDTLINNFGSGASKGFIVKHDSAGNYQWSKSTHTQYAYFLDVATDRFNNVYVIGGYDTAVSLDNYLLTNPYISTSHFPGAAHHFVTKINSSGTVIWIKEIGDVWTYGGNFGGVEIKIDENCNLFVICSYSDTATVGNYVMPNVAPDSSTDILVAKYDSACNPIWARSFGGSEPDVVSGLALSPTGDIYIGGAFHSDTLTIGSQSLINNDTVVYHWYLFVAKLDSLGNGQWLRGTNSGVGFLWEVATNSTGDVFVAGCYNRSPVTFGNYTFPAPPGVQLYGFLVKYDEQGNAIWAKNMQGQYTTPLAICTDLCDNIWVQGTMGHISITTPDTIDGYILSPPTVNAWPDFLAGWDPWGNLITAQAIPTGYDQHPNGLAVDGAGKIYMSAETRDLDTFHIGNDPIINSNDIRQMFLAKFDPEITCWPISTNSVIIDHNIIIYPNPAADKITIISSKKIQQVAIHNIVGQITLEQKVDKETVELNLAQLPAGIFIITVTDSTGNAQTKKIVKE